ncbi:hypothetical protein STANM309S_04947 [Streptomyces tanashiensis]
MRQRGHQVAQRLTGAGAGLDQQFRAAVDRLLDGFGHGHLTGALRTADGGDGSMQELGSEGFVIARPPYGPEPLPFRRTSPTANA